MAKAAVLGECCGRVARIRRAVEIRQMTRYTRGRESGKHVVFMALRAGRDTEMSPGQRKLRRCAVIERRAGPTIGCMACLAGSRKACSYVVWVGRAVEIRQVAGDTSR